MKIHLINTGKTSEKYIVDGVELYKKRILKYLPILIFDIPEIKNVKSMSFDKQKEQEGQAILKQIVKFDHIIVLDEKGLEFSSDEFAIHLQNLMNRGIKNLAFITGGPFGFSKKVYDSAQERISLSRMTFPHQLVRLIFIEQLYRALTILNNEPYHHI
ncbi:MAG TPA: 23S rRNA (pseudouridine(1915)-N(3))-methyltransferase RlmH [Bacteroidales bacterium]|nr:23S rRNA (pseudouridine(1915)-N(3))-methyltransferase RlmH [Bacteroidales bacterium]